MNAHPQLNDSTPDPMGDLATDVKQTCACVFSMLTVNEYDSDEERIAAAANEVRELHRRTEARQLFSGAGL